MLHQCVSCWSYPPSFLSVFQRGVWFPAAGRQIPWGSSEPGGGRASWGSSFPTHVPSRSPGPWETGLTSEKQEGEEEMFLVDIRGDGGSPALKATLLLYKSPGWGPLTCDMGVPPSWCTVGHRAINLSRVCATACWGFCGHLCGHVLSCLSHTDRPHPPLLSSNSYHKQSPTALPSFPWQQASPPHPEFINPRETEIGVCHALQKDKGDKQVS